MGRRSSDNTNTNMDELQQSMNSQHGMNNQGMNDNSSRNNVAGSGAGFGGMNPFDMDNAMSSSQRSLAIRRHNEQGGDMKGHAPNPTAIGTPNDVISGNTNNNGDKPDGTDASQNKSFLDGSFAGGWQSNADLPDRRRIIFSILEVIRQMRPDTNKISQK
jgi:hypothetical protein